MRVLQASSHHPPHDTGAAEQEAHLITSEASRNDPMNHETIAGTGTVAVVIINWNGYDDTVECLESFRRVTYRNHQIVLVDNGSANEEAYRLGQAFPEAHVIANEANEGFARACNQGIECALGEGASYVLLLNNDTVVAPDFLTHLIDHMTRDREVGIAAPLITYYGSDRIWFAGGRLNLWTGRTRHMGIDHPVANALLFPARTQFATGCALLARAELLRKIGGLDDSLFAYFEDVDFCYRARLCGYRIAVVPAAVVEHKVSASAGHRGTNRISRLQAHYLGRNKVLFARRHLHGIQQVAFVASTAILGMAETLKRADTLDAPICYVRGLLRGLRSI